MTRKALILAAVTAGCAQWGNPKQPTPPAGPETLAQLESDTGVTWVLHQEPGYASPAQLAAPNAPPPTATGGVTPAKAALAFLETYGADIFGIVSANDELQLLFEPVPDVAGVSWVSFQQVENGVAVYPRHVLVAVDAEGSIRFVWSGYVPNLERMSVTPVETPADAQNIAQNDLELMASADQLGDLVEVTTPMLTLYPLSTDTRLAYMVSVIYTQENRDYLIDAVTGSVLDSHDPRLTLGSIPFAPNIAGGGWANASASKGIGSLGDTKSFTATYTGNASQATFAYLQQVPPKSKSAMWVQMLDGGTQAGSGNDIPGSDVHSSEVSAVITGAGVAPNAWNAVTGGASLPASGAAVDAYWGVYNAEQWYQNKFTWSSFDNQGTAIPILLDDTNAWNDNACWDPNIKSFHVGRAVGQTYPESVSQDTMGHEYTHGVVNFTLKLVYAGQTGALNEALADEFGQMIESDTGVTSYTASTATDDEGKGAACLTATSACTGIRNLQEPHKSGPSNGPCAAANPLIGAAGGQFAQPNNMLDPIYTGAQAGTYAPNCCDAKVCYPAANIRDVHFYDGVPNAAWYLAAYGGTNSTSKVNVPSGLPWGDMEMIWGDTLLAGCNGLPTPFPDAGNAGCGGNVTKFSDWAFATTTAAGMGGTKSNPLLASNIVGCAWYATGVMDPQVAFGLGATSCECPQGSPAGGYCGDAGVWNGAPNTLFTCDGSGKLTAVKNCAAQNQVCGPPNGTAAMPGNAQCNPNPNTLCNGKPNGIYCGSDFQSDKPTPPKTNEKFSCNNNQRTDLGQCPAMCQDGTGCVMGGTTTTGGTTGGTTGHGTNPGGVDPCGALDQDGYNQLCQGQSGTVAACECASSPWILECYPDPDNPGNEIGGYGSPCVSVPACNGDFSTCNDSMGNPDPSCYTTITSTISCTP